MTKIKRKKIDCQWGIPKMPEDVKRYFFDYFNGRGNDVWVTYKVGSSTDKENKELKEKQIDESYLSILDSWLLENNDVKRGEKIMIKHWW